MISENITRHWNGPAVTDSSGSVTGTLSAPNTVGHNSEYKKVLLKLMQKLLKE